MTYQIPVPWMTVIGDYPYHLPALSTTPHPDYPLQSHSPGCLDTTRRPRSLSGPYSWGSVQHMTQSSNIKDEKNAEIGRVRHVCKREMSREKTLFMIGRGVFTAFSCSPLSLIHAITTQTPRNIVHVGVRTARESENTAPKRPTRCASPRNPWRGLNQLIHRCAIRIWKRGATYGACLMLYAKDSLAVDPKVGLVRVRQSSHARLHPRHEVRPRHPWRRAFETHERLGRLGKVDLAAVRGGGGGGCS